MGLAGDGNVNGFGLEFYIETPGSEIAETIHDVKKSWQFQLLYTVSQLAAGAQIPSQAMQEKHMTRYQGCTLSHSTAEAALVACADGTALHALSCLVQADGKP